MTKLLKKIKKILSYMFYLAVKDKKMRARVERVWINLSQIGVKRRIAKKNSEKYINDKELYCKLNQRKEYEFKSEYEYPILDEWNVQNGLTDSTSYFWQDLWGARRIAEKMPKRHFDIGSRVDGFISHLLVLNIPVTLIDIRPMDAKIGVDYICADATELDGVEDNSIESLSALCSLEHFGLGRYGDPIDPEACFKAFKSIQRVVKSGGYIYISLLVGKDRVCFNAHRVFNPDTVIREFSNCRLEEFSVIDSSSNPALIEKCDWKKYHDAEIEQMGLFCFKKI